MEIKLFAFLADQLGEQITVALDEPVTAQQILTTVREQYPKVSSALKDATVAINQTFVTDDQSFQLAAIHEIALIPPVSGG
ncbi:MoaD/ThiS family protein [Loigolactobacillus bifermentans]|jgi:molybdopterin converting factor small subunit|uniref:Molybdopterin synthase sulfur carrier subunit n=1 Tax=Loigolactobacillus bifermentans DSM 20003 TaxID=1423726 RepID=A0A0R1H1L0_9LACO|nr:MoaD/ThiS family protein [Loigolactobacillus bifermentans]KRK40303.1 hypothetical protein FC07_GL001018 [Loigolactobacillus bifermentans DSM 20003]QGG59989.1 MoaD/ThiS family protein [Loigolactobacillus bifermentans]